jgi:hypothetical protein
VLRTADNQVLCIGADLVNCIHQQLVVIQPSIWTPTASQAHT